MSVDEIASLAIGGDFGSVYDAIVSRKRALSGVLTVRDLLLTTINMREKSCGFQSLTGLPETRASKRHKAVIETEPMPLSIWTWTTSKPTMTLTDLPAAILLRP